METVIHVKGAYDQAGGPETLIRLILAELDPQQFSQRVVILEKSAGAGACVLRESLPHGPPLIARWYGIPLAPLAARSLGRLVREQHGDVIHTHDMRSNLAAYLLTRRRRVPWIGSIHGWLGTTHNRRGQIFESIEGKLVRAADAVMVGSEATRREVEARGGKCVRVIHHGIPLVDPAPWLESARRVRAEMGASDETVIVGVVARVHPGKGLRFLVEALEQLIARRLDVMGLIVGEGPERESLQRYVSERGIADRVRLTGYVDDPRPSLAAMDVVALPTLQDSFPFSVLDGLAIGKPVVTTTVGDLPLAVKDGRNGFLVPPGEVAPLMQALERLVSDRAMRTEFGLQGRETIREHFSPAAMSRNLAALYHEVLDGTPRRS
jgi:glycosyltransferase involved in cell wall biosynthesis